MLHLAIAVNSIAQYGACCDSEGYCIYGSSAQCAARYGVYMGNGTNCETLSCPPAGACCLDIFLGAGCHRMTEAACKDYRGQFSPESDCESVWCDIQGWGACCFSEFECTFTTQDGCIYLEGTYLGDSTECSPGDCGSPPMAGACCFSHGGCRFVPYHICNNHWGRFTAVGTTCDAVDCQGMCCLEDGCEPEDSGICEWLGGVFQGPGTTCGNSCPKLGDYDEDGDMDLSDFATFSRCMLGPSYPIWFFGCDLRDLDSDRRVGLADFAAIQNLFAPGL